MQLLKTISLSWCAAALITATGCSGGRDYRIDTKMDAHGRPTMKKVPLTEEEIAARNAAMGYTPPATRPADPDLASLEELWPRLTAQQRGELLDSARKMTTSPAARD